MSKQEWAVKLSHLKKTFDSLQQDGFISKQKFMNHFSSLPNPSTQQELEMMFLKMDRLASGKIDWEAFYQYFFLEIDNPSTASYSASETSLTSLFLFKNVSSTNHRYFHHKDMIFQVIVPEPKSPFLLTIGFDGSVRKWNRSTLQLEGILMQQPEFMIDQVIHDEEEDALYILCGNYRKIFIYNLTSLEPKRVLRFIPDQISASTDALTQLSTIDIPGIEVLIQPSQDHAKPTGSFLHDRLVFSKEHSQEQSVYSVAVDYFFGTEFLRALCVVQFKQRTYLFLGSHNGILLVYSLHTDQSQIIQQRQIHTKAIRKIISIQFAVDQTHLITISEDGLVCCIDVEQFITNSSFTYFNKTVSQKFDCAILHVLWISQLKLLSICGANGIIYQYKSPLFSKKPWGVFLEHQPNSVVDLLYHEPYQVCISLSTNKTIFVWNIISKQVLQQFTETASTFVPLDRFLCITLVVPNLLVCSTEPHWMFFNHQHEHRHHKQRIVEVLQDSMMHRMIVVCSHCIVVLHQKSMTQQFWFEKPEEQILYATWNYYHTALLLVHVNGAISIFSTRLGSTLQQLFHRNALVTLEIQRQANNCSIAIAGWHPGVQLVTNQEKRIILKEETNGICIMQTIPNHSLVLCAQSNATLLLWDVYQCQMTKQKPSTISRNVECMLWSYLQPSIAWIGYSDGQIEVIDVRSLTTLTMFSLVENRVANCFTLFDNSFLWIGDQSGGVHIASLEGVVLKSFQVTANEEDTSSKDSIVSIIKEEDHFTVWMTSGKGVIMDSFGTCYGEWIVWERKPCQKQLSILYIKEEEDIQGIALSLGDASAMQSSPTKLSNRIVVDAISHRVKQQQQSPNSKNTLLRNTHRSVVTQHSTHTTPKKNGTMHHHQSYSLDSPLSIEKKVVSKSIDKVATMEMSIDNDMSQLHSKLKQTFDTLRIVEYQNDHSNTIQKAKEAMNLKVVVTKLQDHDWSESVAKTMDIQDQIPIKRPDSMRRMTRTFHHSELHTAQSKRKVSNTTTTTEETLLLAFPTNNKLPIDRNEPFVVPNTTTGLFSSATSLKSMKFKSPSKMYLQ